MVVFIFLSYVQAELHVCLLFTMKSEDAHDTEGIEKRGALSPRGLARDALPPIELNDRGGSDEQFPPQAPPNRSYGKLRCSL